MITIPLNTNTGITIPARAKPAQSDSKQKVDISPIAVSIPEAATMLGVSKKTFYPLIKDGKVRTVNIGRRILVSIQSLHEFVDGKKESSHSTEMSEESQDESV